MMMVFSASGENAYTEPKRYQTDSLTWKFDASSGTLSIHGSGPMRSYSSDYPEWESYKDQITAVTIDEGITSVGDYAFYDYENLQTAVLPDSIEVIGCSAFDYCWSLSRITIPKSLYYVGERAFYNTLIHDPVDIVFPEGMEYIGNEAFHSALKTNGRYIIPSTVRYIGSCAFSNAFVSDIIVSDENPFYQSQNHSLMTKDGTELLMYSPCAQEVSYSIPDSVKKLDAESFNCCTSLEKLFIPASVTEIEDKAIFSTFCLKEITIAESNPSYKMIGNALCTIDGKTCLAYPDGIELTEIVIPDGVERIAPYVFYGRNTEKTVVTFPESLRVICILSMPSSISSVTIPKGIETIESYAFCYEGGVEEVFYGGTEADWQAVNIGEYNAGLDSAVMHYAK